MKEMKPHEYLLILLEVRGITQVRELEVLFGKVREEFLSDSPEHVWGFKALKTIAEKAIVLEKDPLVQYVSLLQKHLGSVPDTKRQAKVAASRFHPDLGGDSSLMSILNDAIDHVYGL